MSSNVMINRDYSAEWLQANVTAQIRAMNGWDDDRIDFANLDLNDPKTKKYLQEQQQAEYLIACTMEWIAWQEAVFVEQQMHDKQVMLAEMERQAELAKDQFMENLRQEMTLITTQPAATQSESLSALLGQQKQELQQSIVQLEEQKQALIKIHENLTKHADQVVDSVSKEWQQRHENAVETAVTKYREVSESFLEKKKDPEFQQKVIEFKKLEETYQDQLSKYQEKARQAASDVSKLRYQKNKIEQKQKRLPAKEHKLQRKRDQLNDQNLDEFQRRIILKDIKMLTHELERDKKEVAQLDVVNMELKNAQDNKEAVLKAKADLGLDQLKDDLAAQSEFNEDRHVIRNMHGGIVDYDELQQAMLASKNNIRDVAQADINKVVMHAVDAALEAGGEDNKDTNKHINEVAETAARLNHVLAQFKLMNSKVIKGDEEHSPEPGEIRAMNKKGSAIVVLQSAVLSEEVQQQDFEAAKAVIEANYQVHQAERQISGIDQQILNKGKQLEAVEQQALQLKQPQHASVSVAEKAPGLPTTDRTSRGDTPDEQSQTYRPR